MNLDIDRFMLLVSPEPNSGCWLWLGPSGGKNQRAKFYVKETGKMIIAARWILSRLIGVDLHNLNACHTCDNPMCVNPQHLFPGTQKVNIQDAVKKGRLKDRYHGVPWGRKLTHCLRGHELVYKNGATDGPRVCRQCVNAMKSKRRAELRALGIKPS